MTRRRTETTVFSLSMRFSATANARSVSVCVLPSRTSLSRDSHPRATCQCGDTGRSASWGHASLTGNCVHVITWAYHCRPGMSTRGWLQQSHVLCGCLCARTGLDLKGNGLKLPSDRKSKLLQP